MDVNQVNEVINNICEKIGLGITGLKDFVPLLVKYEILNSTYWIFAGVVFFIVAFMVFKKFRGMYKEASSWEKDGPFFGLLASVIIMIISFCITSSNIFEIVEWCVTPEVKTVVYILSMLK